MKFKILASLFLLGGSLSCFAQGYKDGIEYYKVGQYANAKELLLRNLNEASTDKSEAYYYLGSVALHDNNNAEAKNYFDKGIQANAENPYNYVGLGAIELLNGNTKAAEDNFKTASSKVKKDPKVAVAIARAYYGANATTYAKEITKYTEQAKKYNAKDPDAYIFTGDMAAAEKKWGDAAGMYEMAFTFEPEVTEPYVKYANTYFFVNAPVAIEKLEEVLAKNPESALAQRELAEKYYENDQWTKAAEKYGEYIKNPNHFKQDEVRYVALLFFGKRYQESLDLAKQLTAKLPASDPSNFYMKRMVLYNQTALENWAAAETAAQDFFATSVPAGAKYEPKDFTDYGDVLKKNGKAKEALAQYEKAAAAAPDKIDLLKDLSGAYTDAEDYAKAAEYMQKYIDKGEAKTNDYFILSRRYSNLAATTKDAAVKTNALEKALKYAMEVNEKAPNDYRVMSQIARVQMISEANVKEGKAVDSYKQIISLLDQDPVNKTEKADNYIEAYQYLARHAFETGNKDAMKDYYKKWLEVDPSNNDLRNYVNSLK